MIRMTGEMGSANLKDYPEMVALTKTLKKNGFDAKMLPFDTYLGPYIFINGIGTKIWYNDGYGNRWLVERRHEISQPVSSKEVVKILKAISGKLAR